MINRDFRRRLLNGAVVTASILSMIGYNTAFALENSPSFGSTGSDYNTRSPIKHVIVIIGENRTFDHIFATYQAPNSEHVDNLLSKGIVTINGAPGQNYSLSTQYRASDTSLYSIAPTKVGPYDQNANKEQPAGISYAPQVPYTNFATAAWNGPGALDASVFSLTQLAQIEPDLPHELSASAHHRRDRHRELHRYAHQRLRRAPERRLSARHLDRRQPLRRLCGQPRASLLPDVARTRLRQGSHRWQASVGMSRRPLLLRRDDRLFRQQRRRADKRSRKATSRWASSTSPRATRPI